MFGKLICKLPKAIGGGHRRGKPIGAQGDPVNGEVRVYACPRCGAQHTRKVKVKTP